MYSRVPLLLLDDCFSGVDTENENHIFVHLFGQSGLLRTEGVTVLLATHAVHRLSYADYVYALDEHGTVMEEGSARTLLTQGSRLSRLTQQKSEAEPTQEQGVPPTIKEIAEQLQTVPDSGLSGRHIGDLRVQAHYFAACGWINITVFGALIVGFAVFERFGGMFLFRTCDKKLIQV